MICLGSLELKKSKYDTLTPKTKQTKANIEITNAARIHSIFPPRYVYIDAKITEPENNINDT